MAHTNPNNKYPPKERDFLKPTKEDLESHSSLGSSTKLPDPTKDPIVCNNIAWSEFNYTEGLDDSDQI